MDSDPWNWSVEDVERFFRDEAANYIRDMPYGRLPHLYPFSTRLTENDVNGAILLTTVDSSTLRDEFGIPSLAVRGSVLHCIGKLRRLSRIYTAQNDPHGQQTTSSLFVQVPPLTTGRKEAALPSTENLGEHVRPGEVQVEDAHGRKRRKLNISRVELPKEVKQTYAVGYFADYACPVDELFYGQIDFGREIGNMEPSGDVLVFKADRDAGLEHENFQFTHQGKAVGESKFVYSQIRRFLEKAETVDLRRQGREALAILPYRDGVQGGERSATVLQYKSGGEEPIAIRENAAHLQNDDAPEESVQQAGGEWDFLVPKHNSTDDELLPLYGESEKGDAENSALPPDVEGEQEAAEEVDDDELGPDRPAEVIEAAIKECVADWHENLPKLEEKRAWSVWKKIKQSRTIRNALIQSAQAKIEHFTNRLNTLTEELMQHTWSSEESLLKAFGTVESTVEDREEQRWMITVWRRKQEPPHTVHHGTQGAHSGLQTPATGTKGENGMTVHPNDRFSISPAPVATAEADNEAEAESRYEADDEEMYHTPINSPMVSPGAKDDLLDSPDGVALDMEEDEDEQGVKEELDADLQPELPTALGDIDVASNGNDSSYSPEYNSDSDGLPSPSTFISQRKQHTEPKATSRSSIMPIDLTMSSDSPTPRSTPRKRERQGTNPTAMLTDPFNATSAEVAAWDFSHLAKTNDRLRILIYLLHQAGSKARDELAHVIGSRSKFNAQLQAALQAYRSSTIADAEPRSDITTTMLQAAQIYLQWAFPTLPEQETKTLDKARWMSVSSVMQINPFTQMLATILHKMDTKLFISQKSSSSRLNSSSAPIEISSSDDRPHQHHTPHRKRKQLVHRSMTAQDSRKSAFDRQKRFNESQRTDSTRLAAMIASDPSDSHVQINPAKDENDEFIYICDRIARKMKGHQIDGVRFLWREITADGEEGGQGCILAHTMGLGKTMQTIALLVALNEAVQSKDRGVYGQLPTHLRAKGIRGNRQLRVVILSPPALLQNWRREIDRWAPKQLSNIFSLEPANKTSHLQLLEDWMRFGGVVLLGYQMFRSMITRKPRKPEQKNNARSKEDSAELEKLLLEGSEIVIADEAHNLKNNKSGVAKAAERFKTESRIGLTGTPMSNDVQEIYALVSWVGPGFLGDQQEFNAHYTEPIQEGLYHDSSHYERRVSIKKLKVLHAEIEPKVNRANIEVLRGSLKPKIEFVITVPLGEVQVELYKRYIKALQQSDRSEKASQVRIFGWLAILTLLANHPRCFRQKLLAPPPTRPSKQSKKNGAVKEGIPREDSPSTTESAAEQGPDAAQAVPTDEPVHTLGFSEEMIHEIIGGFEDDMDPTLSAKVNIFLELLDFSLESGDKSLVFTTSIPTLEFLDELLRQRGNRFGRIDGQTAMGKRMKVLEDFHSDNFEIMLVSTRAGGVGLNIQGANRVFIFDFGFNPTWEEQAIGRAYRLGQMKPVFVYRFMAGGTFETNIYNKQLFKTSLAQRVVDKKNPRRNAERNTREYLYEPTEVPQEDLAGWIGKDAKVLDRLLRQHGSVDEGGIDTKIRSIRTMETLQEDAMDAPLDEEEEKEVKLAIEQGRNRPRGRKAANAGVAMPAPAFANGHASTAGSFPRPAPAPFSRPPPSTMDGAVPSRIVSLPHPFGGLPMPR